MGVLRIYLFGTVQVSHDGRADAEARLIHAVQALLAYLLLHRKKAHAREVLGGIFWGEHTDARARSCLSTALWRLRQVLEPIVFGVSVRDPLVFANPGRRKSCPRLRTPVRKNCWRDR
jgi:DNA-binding SARP family transcriptional activator